MFRNLFNPDSGLMITMSQITDCIFLSLFFLVGCIPVVTIGASAAALYDSVVHAYRQGDKHSWQRFFKVYRENWKGSILPTLVFLAVFWAMVRGLVLLWNGAVYGKLSWAVFAAGAFFGLVVMGMLSVVFPMVSRFENSFPGLLKNTVFLSMAQLPMTLGLGLVNGACFLLTLRYVFPLFFLPALASLISSIFLERMFRPFQ